MYYNIVDYNILGGIVMNTNICASQNSICNSIDISSLRKPKRTATRYTAVTRGGVPKETHASYFRRSDIEKIVADLLNNGKYFKAAQFVFGCNTGYRAGDICSLRVGDLLDDNGEIKTIIDLQEHKTGKWRYCFLNETVRKMLKFIFDFYQMSDEDFIFQSGENKRCYIEEIYENDGEEPCIITTGEKYDWNGKENLVAPMTLSGITRFLKRIANSHGIEGKFSSHSYRQTYAHYISLVTVDKDYEGEVDLRFANASFGHSSMTVTNQHYNGVDLRELKRRMLNLNLGGQAVDRFLGQ